MAHRPGTPSPSPADRSALRFELADPELRPEALAMLLTGRRDAGEPAVRPFLAFAQEHDLDLDALWVAWDARRMAAATLIIPGVGKTAMLFLSPVASSGRVTVCGQLIAHALAPLSPQETCLVQSLIEQGQSLQQKAVEAGGFRLLADLAYMHRSGRRLDPPPAVCLDDQPLTPVTWSEADRPLFVQAIETSYQDTQDCPGLLGLRDIHDILAGHRATGRFDPADWRVWRAPDGRPAAVMLLAESTGTPGVELVYLGVSPHARGKGLAKTLMRLALDRTARHGHGDLFLAVDDQNQPALRLYRGLGFKTSTRKTALIYTPV
ncbi:MAG: GNAT family N-acetyltransferase [Planctomycetota bacterium]